MPTDAQLVILVVAATISVICLALIALMLRNRQAGRVPVVVRATAGDGSAGTPDLALMALSPRTTRLGQSEPSDGATPASAPVPMTVVPVSAGEESRSNGESAPNSPPVALVDPVTGLSTRLAWDEVIRREGARLLRYRHPLTVVAVEVDGFESLTARLGAETADTLIPPVAAELRSSARAADVIARVGRARFLVLLPETDEVTAINYVERVRGACDMWLESGSLALRLAIGWASPTPSGTIEDAVILAQERMNAERRRAQRAARPAPIHEASNG